MEARSHANGPPRLAALIVLMSEIDYRQILTGRNPAQLPVEGIDKLKFVINLKTAKQTGLNIPEGDRFARQQS
jgi:hypothetical protein